MHAQVEGHESEKRVGWRGDVLNRKPFADILTNSLSLQANSLADAHKAGLAIALDDDWGTGKSFFITHWSEDLRALGHPVVVFDAWENDIGDEAAVAMMSAIRAEFGEWQKRLHKNAIRQQLRISTDKAIRGLRKAIVPASKVLATSLLKKGTGIALEDLVRAMDTGNSPDLAEQIGKASSIGVDEGLDRLFKSLLDEHQKRRDSILAFKSAITKSIELLESGAKAKLPVFIFIDEVDRCRPPYAIKLLEEIKHLFGVPKICFVVSTNLNQLKESVCAIYGSGFDSYRYLQRFFDYRYTLPKLDNERFSTYILKEYPLPHRRFALGLPVRQGTPPPTTEFLFAQISRAFSLDLRSQKQVLLLALSVMASIQKEKNVFLMWLLFLCALRHKSQLLFDELPKVQTDSSKFHELCGSVLHNDVEITYTHAVERPNHPYHSSEERRVALTNVLWRYSCWSLEDLSDLRDKANRINRYDYPEINLDPITEEMPNQYNRTTEYRPSIAKYYELVKLAGMMVPDDDA